MKIPPDKGASPSARLSGAYVRLAQSAARVNAISDALGSALAAADEQLNQLNLGIPAWVVIEEDVDEDSETYSRRLIGYDKVDGRWGIALRTESGEWDPQGQNTCKSWLFNDAPRQLRMLALGKLPDLFEELVSQADGAVVKLEAATEEAQQLAAALQQVRVVPAKKGAR